MIMPVTAICGDFDRERDPKTRLIPQRVFAHPGIFDIKLSESEMKIIHMPSISLIKELRTTAFENEALKHRCWLAIAYTHPDLDDKQLDEIAHLLHLPESKIFQLAVTLERRSYLDHKLHSYTTDQTLAKMNESDHYAI